MDPLDPGRRRRREEAELDAELAHHFELTRAEFEAGGMTPEEAERAARKRFGSVRRHRRAILKIDGEGEGRMKMGVMEVLEGLRNVLRGMARAPRHSIAVVLTLALGIGANVTVFGMIDRLLLRAPDHVEDPDGLRRLVLERWFDGERSLQTAFAGPDIDALAALPGVEALFAYDGWNQDLTWSDGEAMGRARVVRTTWNIFDVLGARPRLGRAFTPEDDRPDAAPTAVLSWGFWQDRYGGDAEVIGRDIELGTTTYRVIGVAPRGFTGADSAPVDIWVAIRAAVAATGDDRCFNAANCWFLSLVGRLDPAVSPEVTSERMIATVAGLRDPADAQWEGASVIASPLLRALGPEPPREARVARWLTGIALLVFLLACANVVSILLDRVTSGARALSIRRALGAGRLRLAVEQLAELALLAMLGAAAALGVAWVGGGPLRRTLMPEVADLPFVDARLVGVALLGVLLAVALAGVAPVAAMLRSTAPDGLTGGTRSTGRRSRLRSLLLVAQTALSVVLLVGSGMFLASFERARSTDLGWDPEPVRVAMLEFDGSYAGDERARIYGAALEEVRRLPGVVAAAATYSVPFRSSISIGIGAEGMDSLPAFPTGGPYLNLVGPDYLRAMDLRIVEGRGFEHGPVPETPPAEAIVNETMAARLWPGSSAIGRCLLLGDDPTCVAVVGVVEDHRRQALEEEETGLYFLPNGISGLSAPPQAFMVRVVPGGPGLEEIRAAAAAVDPRIRWVEVDRLEEYVEPHRRAWRTGATLFTVFGVLALVVASLGLYGALSFEVGRRVREIGIRAALGASRGRLLGRVVLQGTTLASIGTVLGLAIGWFAARRLAPILFHTSPAEPFFYAVAGAAMILVATAATLVPGIRAARLDPREAFRE